MRITSLSAGANGTHANIKVTSSITYESELDSSQVGNNGSLINRRTRIILKFIVEEKM